MIIKNSKNNKKIILLSSYKVKPVIMKRTRKLNLLILLAFMVGNVSMSVAQEGYQFTDVKRLDVTSVKDQHRSGTCWSFSGLAFLEAEMLRMGKKDVPYLSPMFVVRNCYYDKAVKYVRLHGHLNLGGGGAFHDVLYVLKNNGLVPNEVYPGLNYGEDNHVHGELDELLLNYGKSIVKNKNKKLSTAWKKGFNLILDTYLGKSPEHFKYKGKTYTPKTFAKDVTGLNADDYVSLTSYTHHPFYEKFIMELPDNWLWESSYNVKLNELKEVIDYALNNGYLEDIALEHISRWESEFYTFLENSKSELLSLIKDSWTEEVISSLEQAIREFNESFSA